MQTRVLIADARRPSRSGLRVVLAVLSVKRVKSEE